MLTRNVYALNIDRFAINTERSNIPLEIHNVKEFMCFDINFFYIDIKDSAK